MSDQNLILDLLANGTGDFVRLSDSVLLLAFTSRFWSRFGLISLHSAVVQKKNN
jgi:hypothetical protein